MGEILFIAHRIPFPPDRGDKIRSWNMVRKLDGIAPVHIAAFADDERDMAHAPALSEVAASHRIVLRDRNRPLAAMRGLLRGQPLSVALFDHHERCPICQTADPGKPDWCIDHDHETREVRGLLCSECNMGIGLLYDNIANLTRAQAYLEGS